MQNDGGSLFFPEENLVWVMSGAWKLRESLPRDEQCSLSRDEYSMHLSAQTSRGFRLRLIEISINGFSPFLPKTSLYELKVICFLVLVIFAECAKKVSYKIIRFSFLNCFKMKEKRRQNTLRSKNVIYRAMNSYSKRIKKIRIAWISYRTSYLMEWIDHAFRIAISGVKAAHL